MSKNFNQERLLQVLVAPQISEKATYVADKNEQVIFIVTPDATKPEVKAAVELLFKVEVESVQIANLKGKVKRSGRSIGRRSEYPQGVRLPQAGSGNQLCGRGGCLNGSGKS
jgi:large subunit ribosomal protein L23